MTAPDTPRIEHIGLQLYTVRSVLATDIPRALNAIAAAGITELEFAGYYNKPATWWRSEMAARGLTAPSTHVGLPASDAEWAAHFDYATAMDHRWVIVPSVPRSFHSPDGYARLADRLNAGGALANARGLRIGFHNHDAEFAPLEGNTNGWSILMANTDKAFVDFELDLYWAVKAGQDPLTLLRTHGARIACVHVKDAGPAPARAMMDVGAGTLDFRTLLAAGRAGALKHWFIEHDEPADPLASIAASAAAMRAY